MSFSEVLAPPLLTAQQEGARRPPQTEGFRDPNANSGGMDLAAGTKTAGENANVPSHSAISTSR